MRRQPHLTWLTIAQIALFTFVIAGSGALLIVFVDGPAQATGIGARWTPTTANRSAVHRQMPPVL